MLRFLQTPTGEWHVSSVILFIGATVAFVVALIAAITALGFVIWRLVHDADERVRIIEARTIEKAEVQITLEFSKPIPFADLNNKIPLAFLERTSSSSLPPAYLMVQSFGPVEVEGGIAKKLSVTLVDGRYHNTPNGLDTISAKLFPQQVDYLKLHTLSVYIPKDVSYWGTAKFKLNEWEHEFPIPKHNPSDAPLITIPFNAAARKALEEFALYSESGKGRLHYTDLDNPTKVRVD